MNEHENIPHKTDMHSLLASIVTISSMKFS